MTVETIVLEDPNSGIKGKSLDGLSIKNNSLFKLGARQSKIITIQLSNSTQSFSLRKNLILESATMVQRVPLKLETDPEALMLVYPTMSPELLNAFTVFKFLNICIGVLIMVIIFMILLAIMFPKIFRIFMTFDNQTTFDIQNANLSKYIALQKEKDQADGKAGKDGTSDQAGDKKTDLLRDNGKKQQKRGAVVKNTRNVKGKPAPK